MCNYYSVSIETQEKPLFFKTYSNALKIGSKPIKVKVSQEEFDKMLSNGAFEDAIPAAEEVGKKTVSEPQNETENPIEIEKSQSIEILNTQEQEEIRTILENLKAQVDKLTSENIELKNRPHFSELVRINERCTTIQNHIERFEVGKTKLESIKQEINNYTELDEPEFITLVFIRTTRETLEVEELCRISDTITIDGLTTSALAKIDNRINSLVEEKTELQKKL